ncbi:hypothetical protein LCGC14_1529280 [marine sediment metagenome]|uniref:Uncharacterized protein n=1 Tax=marine sediment metagenome TaxID=412755 RepID=A0A0F9IW99_9ZZZZ
MNDSTQELGINLTGVIKSIVLDVIHEQSKIKADVEELSRAGSKWSTTEINKLRSEYATAIAIIAQLHSRSPGGIHSQLAHMDDLRY